MILKRCIPWFLLLTIVLMTASCTNLKAVNEWSKTSLEASQYNRIVSTYADTLQRIKKYDPDGLYAGQIDIRKKQVKALNEILGIITDYMAALSVLSSDSTINYDKDVDTLTKSIKELDSGISNDTLGAAGSLVKTILEASAKAYQAKEISLIVESADPHLQTILNGELKSIIDKDFRRDLKFEKKMMDRFYDALVQQGQPSPAAQMAIQEWKEYRMAQNAKRVKAVDAYVVILSKVSKGHAKLYESRDDLDAIELTKDLFSLVKDIRSEIKILIES